MGARAMHLKPIADRRLERIRARARAACERPNYAEMTAYVNAQPSAAVTPVTETTEAANERRRHGRVGVESAMMVRRIGVSTFHVALKDISAGGCRVVMLEPGEIGDPVIARLPQLEPLGSRLCWTEGTTTGVQFLRTMHPAVFDMLLTRLSSNTAGPA